MYYERQDIALSKLDALKGMEPADRAEYRARNRNFIKLAAKFKSSNTALKALRKRRNRWRVKTGVTEAQRAKELEQIQEKMNVQFNKVNRAWNVLIEKNVQNRGGGVQPE